MKHKIIVEIEIESDYRIAQEQNDIVKSAIKNYVAHNFKSCEVISIKNKPITE